MKNKIEEEFERMELQHRLFSNKHYTCEADVLQLMLDRSDKVWWWAYEFNGQKNSKGVLLSHRACARASDLALQRPLLVEDRKIGRFKVYRLRVENMNLIYEYMTGHEKTN